MLRILVADDHSLVRHGICRLIEANVNWTVCAEAKDGAEAIELTMAEKPDILILDISLPLINGVTVARRLSEALPKMPILVFTMHDDNNTIAGALSTGVRAYILKSEGGQHLIAGIKALIMHQTYFSAVVTEYMLKAATTDRTKPELENFTVRELEVAQQIAEGHSNKVIARHLQISPKTVESHRASIMRKAAVHSGTDLVRFAVRNGLISL